jgi:BirA family biotin operon repressor/biotin-[acetyl-CoA-carboxylase] ligase
LSREVIREKLIESLGSWTSGQKLAGSLKISRAAVWKQVQSLRSEGYEIESSKRGYRLASLPDLINEDLVKSGLKTRFVGRTIHRHPSLTSTNAEAKRIAPSAKNGTVVVAEVQTLGRGRMERPWHSPKGGVWMSIILKPRIPPNLAPRVNMAAAVAVARALEGLYALDVRIKWPNDLLVGEKKVSGILTEIGAEMDLLNYAVVGIGINANLDPALFPEEWRATSLSGLLGRDILRRELVQRVLVEVEVAFADLESSFDGVREEWKDRSATLGRRVRIITRDGEFEGRAEALEADGSLLVRRDDGRRERVYAGDCVHLRPATEMPEEGF